jgi:IS30 family transposase
LQSGHSQAHIARKIGVDPSTISRELARNTGARGYGSASLRERLYCKTALSPSQRMMAIPGSCLITDKSS